MLYLSGIPDASILHVLYPEFATYEMLNPKPGKGLGCFMA